MTEPTDDEIVALADETRTAEGGANGYILPISFARAVLAKWGNPAPVGVEPIGYLYCGGSYGDELEDWEIVADQHQCDKLNEHHGSLGKEAKLPLYTTAQPTQAQVGAVPLTDEQIRAMLNKHPPEDVCGWSYRMGIDDAELHHGITGGQHGTD